MFTAVFWSALATGTLLIGMALAYRNLVSLKWTGLIMAFGAGAIISAAAYQLVGGAIAAEQGAYYLVGLGIAAGALLVMLTDSMIPESFEHGGKESGLFLVVGFSLAVTMMLLQAG